MPFTADAVEYVAKNQNVICYWFTIDTTYARLTIAKHACPEGYVANGQPYEAVLQACPTPLEGVRFDFDTSGTNYDVTAPGSQSVDWPVDLVFWGNATRSKVYSQLRWIFSGSTMYALRAATKSR